MVGKLLGGGLVLLGTALWCRGEIQARRRETDRAAELAAALGGMAHGETGWKKGPSKRGERHTLRLCSILEAV